VLRCEAVIDGDDDGGDSPAETSADGVVCERIRREECEGAAVEENEDGEAVVGIGGGGVVDSEPEVPFGVDGDVFGGNAFNGFGVGLGFAIEEVHETAINSAVRAA